MLLISFVVVQYLICNIMYVCVQLFPAVCRLLELNKLIIQINKSNQQMTLIDYKEFQVLPL